MRNSRPFFSALMAGLLASVGAATQAGPASPPATKRQPKGMRNLGATLHHAHSGTYTRDAGRKARRDAKRGDQGQRPKLAKERVRKAHQHPLRDQRGAFTLVGREPLSAVLSDGVLITRDGKPRYGARNGRIWLAGISAQRGY